MSQKQQQIEWRRAKVLELFSQGYNHSEIAQKMQVDRMTIHRDKQFLRQQAQENLQKHIHEVVPEEYQQCMVGMKHNLKHVLEIGEQATDPKIKLESRRIANDCYKYIMDLCTNAGVVTEALNFVSQLQPKIGNMQKQLDKKDKTEAEEKPEGEQQPTTTGIY